MAFGLHGSVNRVYSISIFLRFNAIGISRGDSFFQNIKKLRALYFDSIGEEGRGRMERIKIAVTGLGNCASSLIQGIYYYKNKVREDAIGLMHWDIGGYKPYDLDVVAAIDIDKRKVGRDISEALFALPWSW